MTTQDPDHQLTSTAAADEYDVVLRDGTQALIRPIRSTDKTRLQEGLARLSPQSRYLRFHTPVDHLTEVQLRYLTEIDYTNHMAWVAINAAHPQEPGMGVARYVRLAEEPTVAEAAVTVLDEYQGRGLGTVLLNVLAASAVRHGITTFRNYVLAENRAMLEIFEQLGGVRISQDGAVYQVDVALPVTPADVGPATQVQDVLRAVARDAAPPFRWVFPWTALGRHDDTDTARDDTDTGGPPGPGGKA